MSTHDMFTFLLASLAAGAGMGFAASQYRTWMRARRSRRFTARLLGWD